MKIKEVIVVEGKNDSKRIGQVVDADFVETNGYNLTKATLQYLKELQKKRGLIIFTDPDHVGQRIRERINQAIPECKNAYLLKNQARTTKKVGVEHASLKDIEAALSNLVEYSTTKTTLSYQDYYNLKLTGYSDSQKLREVVCQHFHLGDGNGKTIWKRLNMLEITVQELKEVLDENNNRNL